jgi:hypothetical protein
MRFWPYVSCPRSHEHLQNCWHAAQARNAFRGSTWVTGLYGFNGEAVPSDGRVIEITIRVLSSEIGVEITKVVARVGEQPLRLRHPERYGGSDAGLTQFPNCPPDWSLFNKTERSCLSGE